MTIRKGEARVGVELKLVSTSEDARDGVIDSGMDHAMETGCKRLDALLAHPA